ncbi:neuronal acetylcholine receptor subunit alpha-5-like isoform X1 [Uranotaenia lowii]|uniref:neuronal acetylcholine receptor subunit alpha-5-like isoform X1 n=1 Tax=Uranotaenia lowii TaxID=190385 RepID=UPI002479E83F|nr:neuronal acetylcholine receptor subunit alpha-5-like isoform X1 [Uranotaenia lowii]
MHKIIIWSVLIGYLIVITKAEDQPSSSGNPSVVSETWGDKLKKDLLAHYDRNIRPTQHYNVTNVNLKFTIRHVDIDEENSIFSVYGWIKMSWVDLRMKWTPSDYGGLQSILISSYYLWDPELNMYSTTLETEGTSYSSLSNVRVESNGQHNCTTRIHFKTFCEMNFRQWPFDTQHCPVVWGKTVLRDEEVVQLNAMPVDLNVLIHENPTWRVTDMKIEDHQDPLEEANRKFIGVQYGLSLKRRVKIFQSTLIAPAIVFILMTLANFWLPPSAGEKILLNCINAVILCVFLLYFTVQLPMLATRTPLIVLFFSNSLYLTAFSLIISVMVVNMVKSKHRNPIHPYVKAFVDLPGINVLIWTGNDSKKPALDEEDWSRELRTESLARESCSSADEATQAHVGIQQDWIRFAVVLERILFVIYVFIYSIMASCYLS